MLSSNHKMAEASSAYQLLEEQKENEKERKEKEKEAERIGSYIRKNKLSQKVSASVLCPQMCSWYSPSYKGVRGAECF